LINKKDWDRYWTKSSLSLCVHLSNSTSTINWFESTNEAGLWSCDLQRCSHQIELKRKVKHNCFRYLFYWWLKFTMSFLFFFLSFHIKTQMSILSSWTIAWWRAPNVLLINFAVHLSFFFFSLLLYYFIKLRHLFF